MIEIRKITVKHILDESPDLSYLEQEYEEETAENRATYKEQDKKRLDAYNNNQWCCIGIRAFGEFLVPFDDHSGIIEHISSGGLWGIESDTDASEIKGTEEEQIAELKKIAGILNINVPANVEIEYKRNW